MLTFQKQLIPTTTETTYPQLFCGCVVNREIKRLMRSFAASGDTSPDEDDATLLDKLHLVGGSISSVC